MDVEKLQKINALANELKKHQFAKDNAEAYNQAETVYSQTVQDKKEEKSAPNQIDDALIEQKFQMLLQMHLRKYDEEITRIKSTVNKLAEEINVVRAKAAETPKETKEKQQELKHETAAESHPKRGNYTSADVDLQKMFYFGNRR